jgi:hypothetical protein
VNGITVPIANGGIVTVGASSTTPVEVGVGIERIPGPPGPPGVDGTPIVALTYAEFQALNPPVPGTVYLIVAG